MIVKIDGDISRTYCQNLCLIFFPGAKFPENEAQTGEIPEASIVIREENGVFESHVTLFDGKKTVSGNGRASVSQLSSSDRAKKLAVGKAFQSAGEVLLGQAPPWGILTGVRPVKIADELINKGLTREEAVMALENEYLLRPDKAKLLTEVNARQKYARSILGKDTCSLYISIPFCPTRCAYCSFVSYSTPRYLSTLPDYLDKLCLDIAKTCRKINESGKSVSTVYIGGGTPTVLDEKQLARLLSTVVENIKGHNILEFTVEAGRPDTVTTEKFDIMTSYGVDRTSINPQILDDSVLREIGRRHTVEDFYRAYEIASKSGIKSINTDLIAGLPSATEESFCKTVDKIIELAPQNVTVHTYCVKRSASFTTEALEQGDKRGIYSFFGSISSACVDYSQKALSKAGYFPYYLYRQKNAQGNLENVGFCRDGFEGLYNIYIMEELQDIYAVGAGAVSKFLSPNGGKIERIFEPKYTYEYINK